MVYKVSSRELNTIAVPVKQWVTLKLVHFRLINLEQ